MVMAETPRCLAKDFRFTPSRRGALDLAGGVARRTRQIRLGDYNVKDTKPFPITFNVKVKPFLALDSKSLTAVLRSSSG